MLLLQSINAEERWNGASFGSILRRSRDYDASSNENILSISLVLSSTKSKIKQVEYLSLLLQVLWLANIFAKKILISLSLQTMIFFIL